MGDAEGEPVFARAALGDDLGEHLLGRLEALVLHQLLRVHAPAVEILRVFLPMLLEATEQVFQADGDRTTIGVLHLHRRAVEAEHLPHLVDFERYRTLLQRLVQLVAGLAQGQHDQRVAGNAAGKGADGGDDGSAALDLQVGLAVGGARRIGLAHRRITSCSTRSAK
ncbi:MAG: hypothetical protein QM756_06155 [Polyangiaceae bacterium]